MPLSKMTLKRQFPGRLAHAVCTLLCASATAFAQHADPAPVAVEQAVLETSAKMNAAANRLDPDAFFEFILDSEHVRIIQDGVPFRSRAEALAEIRRGFEGIAKLDRRFDRQTVTMLTPETALLVADGSLDATLSDGRTLQNRFAVSLVFVLHNGSWKMLHGHYSTAAAR